MYILFAYTDSMKFNQIQLNTPYMDLMGKRWPRLFCLEVVVTDQFGAHGGLF